MRYIYSHLTPQESIQLYNYTKYMCVCIYINICIAQILSQQLKKLIEKKRAKTTSYGSQTAWNGEYFGTCHV